MGALVVDRGGGGVDVFRDAPVGVRGGFASRETDDPAVGVVEGEDGAVAEQVDEDAEAGGPGQPGGGDLPVGEPQIAEVIDGGRPPGRGVPGDAGIKTAAGEVPGHPRLSSTGRVEGGGSGEDLEDPLQRPVGIGGAGAILRVILRLGGVVDRVGLDEAMEVVPVGVG